MSTNGGSTNTADVMKRSRIVVGVDGSEPAARALRWAVEEAQRRGARVEAVYAWCFPPYAIPAGYPGDAQLAEEAREELAAAVKAALGHAVAEVEQIAVREEPGPVLVNASRGADLLVVGSHGRGGLGRLLLGSVSQYVARRAHCPVVIHPAHADTPDATGEAVPSQRSDERRTDVRT